MAYLRLRTSTLAKAVYPDTGQLGPNQFLPPGTLLRDVPEQGAVQDYLASHDGGETWYRYRSWEPDGLRVNLGPIRSS